MRLFIEINCDQILFKYGHEYDICHRNRPSMLCSVFVSRSPAAGPKAAGSHKASIERSTRPPLIARPPDKLPAAGLWRVACGARRRHLSARTPRHGAHKVHKHDKGLVIEPVISSE